MKLEGIVLNKNLVKSSDLICKLLLRSGNTIDVMFYGGAGSKRKKSSVIEIGALLNIEISNRKTGVSSEIKIAKEYLLSWRSEKIRYNFEAYSLICFFSELVTKISVKYSEDTLDSDEHSGIFNVLTNAVFHIDKSVEAGTFNKFQFLPIFLIKTFYYMGIFPDTKTCRTCNSNLDQLRFVFRGDFGGFVCENCLSSEDSQGANYTGAYEDYKLFRQLLNSYFETSFKELDSLTPMTKENVQILINYLLYNFQISPDSLKSLPMVL
jgi:recombinational DNA repair protein (RecF pathway)